MIHLKYIRIYALVFLFLQAKLVVATTFSTLPSLIKYTESIPEYPFDENQFSHQKKPNVFYQKFNDIKKYISKLKFGLHVDFLGKEFQQLLEEVSQKRELHHSKGRFIEKILPSDQSSIIIWGELNGAFHSLVRGLQELKALDFITDDFKIVNNNTYLIFNGNVIGKSPYIMQALMVVLTLMKNNPENVFYIKGALEDKERWIKSDFMKQLTDHIDKSSTKSVTDLLGKFFGTLPLALYLISPDQRESDNKKLVRISYFPSDKLEFSESEFPYFFDVYADPILSLAHKIPKYTHLKSTIAAAIYVEDRTNEYTASNGLFLQSKRPDGVSWITASSPTATFRSLYQFFNDAFVIIKTANELSKWTITLYQQDVRKLAGFKQDPPFFLINGQLVNIALKRKVIDLANQLETIRKNTENLLKHCIVNQPVKPNEDKKVESAPKEISFYDYKAFKYNLDVYHKAIMPSLFC